MRKTRQQHTKMKKSNDLTGWRLQVSYLVVFLLPVALKFIFLESILIIPPTYAVSPDQTVTYHQPLHLTSNDYYTTTSSGDVDVDIDIDSRDITFSRSHNNNSNRRVRSSKGLLRGRIAHNSFTFAANIFERSPLRQYNIFSKKEKKKDWARETTRLVGGANSVVDKDESSQQNDLPPSSSSSSSSSTSPSSNTLETSPLGRKSFLGDLLVQKRQFFTLPKETEETIRKNIQHALEFAQKTTSRAGPSLLTALSLVGSNGQKKDISILTLYSISLLGASCGFHLFLHFITLGYALGVTLPLAVALLSYQKHYVLPLPTVLHSSITIIWGIRLFSFLAIREYVTWPALHQKVVEVQTKMKIPFASKILCWFVYSFFYVCLMASCWSRLLQSSSSSLYNWGFLGYGGLLLQLVGLSLETIADLQKHAFKSRHRHSWCNIGVWKLSTHPNYLGEGLFWWGTYLAHGFHSPLPSILATIGLALILYVLKGSAKSLSSKQKEKYGQEVDFCQFQRTHNVFGPKQHNWRLHQGAQAITPPPAEGESSPSSNNARSNSTSLNAAAGNPADEATSL